jgi:hypothetical protein
MDSTAIRKKIGCVKSFKVWILPFSCNKNLTKLPKEIKVEFCEHLGWKHNQVYKKNKNYPIQKL